MKPSHFILTIAVCVGTISASAQNPAKSKPSLSSALAEAAPISAETIISAAQKLSDASNYSWTTTDKTSQNSGTSTRTTKGATEKNGFTLTAVSFSNSDSSITISGPEQSLYSAGQSVLLKKGKWYTAEEFRAVLEREAAARGGNSFSGPARPPEKISDPAAHATELIALAGKVIGLESAGGVIVGRLTDQAAAEKQGVPRTASAVKRAGTAKFWVKEGVIEKYQVTVNVSFENRSIKSQLEKTSTTEIKNVGSTKVVVPDAAKKKLDSLSTETAGK